MSPIKSIITGISGSIISKVSNVGIGTTISFAGIACTSTGDTFVSTNGYRYHVFTRPGNLYVSDAGYIDHFVVGGGAGGFSGPQGPTPNPTLNEGPGGGGGGVNQDYRVLFPAGTYTIVVGPGGLAPGGAGNPSYIIGPSGISSITAGGAPGGPSGSPQLYAVGSSGAFPANSVPASSGGGGGGAGGAGGFAGGSPATTGGKGGDGLAAFNGDPGVPSSYGVANPAPLPGRWFAGGGGGGGNNSSTGTAGGSDGTTPGTSVTPNAYLNTGGGGGGGRWGGRAGNGGPGIVIIRFNLISN